MTALLLVCYNIDGTKSVHFPIGFNLFSISVPFCQINLQTFSVLRISIFQTYNTSCLLIERVEYSVEHLLKFHLSTRLLIKQNECILGSDQIFVNFH